jgi:inosine-uridine nucleoside N-ribohydrolase
VIVAERLPEHQRFHDVRILANDRYPVHDAVAVAELVLPGLLTTEYLSVVVDCSSELSRGRTVVDRRGRSGREPTPVSPSTATRPPSCAF